MSADKARVVRDSKLSIYDYRDRLEGGFTLQRIRRIRTVSYAALAVTVAGLLALELVGRGASLKPVFLPLDTVLVTLLVVLLLASLMAMYFRFLEFRHSRRHGQKYLRAKTLMNRAFLTIVLASILLAVFGTPWTHDALGASLSDQGSEALNPAGLRTYTVSNQDSLGIVHAASFHVRATTGLLRTTVSSSAGGFEVANVSAPGERTFVLRASAYAVYTVTVENVGFVPASYEYSLSGNLFAEAYSTLPYLALAFIASHAVWAAYLRPIRSRYASASIYSFDYTPPVARGETVFSDYARRSDTLPSPEAPYPPAVARGPAILKFVRRGEDPPPFPPASAPPPASDSPIPIPGRSRVLDRGKAVLLRFVPDSPSKGDGEGMPETSAPSGDEGMRSTDLNSAASMQQNVSRLLADRRWDEALSAANTLLEERPDDSVVLEFRGDALVALGRRAEASAAYETAIGLRPESDVLQKKLGSSRIDVPALLSRALIRSASGNHSEAITLFEQILEVERDHANALIGKAIAHRRAGHSDEALACLDTVLKREEGNPSALLNLGRIRVDRGEYEPALTAYDRLLEVNPRDDVAWTAKGDALTLLNRNDEATDCYRRAIDINASNEEANAKLREFAAVEETPGDFDSELLGIRGVGPAKFRAFRDAGFRTARDFEEATLEQVRAVPGIPPRLAAEVYRHFHPESRQPPDHNPK